ncbi:MAG: hypothetical protein ABI718_09030 [Acidobacteriota bacterium]
MERTARRPESLWVGTIQLPEERLPVRAAPLPASTAPNQPIIRRIVPYRRSDIPRRILARFIR